MSKMIAAIPSLQGYSPGMLSGPLIIATATETGEKFIQTGVETGHRIPGLPNPMSKDDIEKLHLDRYRNDHFRLYGSHPFRSATRGTDPPDFVVTSSDGDTWGLDCAAFADRKRRQAADMMRQFREVLRRSAGQRDFSRIRGCEVVVHFSKSMDALPSKVKDRDAIIGSLLDAMAACQYDREAWIRLDAELKTSTDDRLFENWPENSYSLADGSGFYVNLRYSDAESCCLPSGLGFEVRLNVQSVDFVSGLFDRLTKLVSVHDKPNISQLLITTGGPDKQARCYPEEDMTASFLLREHPDLQAGGKGLEVKHLSRVTLHSWGQGTAVDLPLKPVH